MDVLEQCKVILSEVTEMASKGSNEMKRIIEQTIAEKLQKL
jgi:altronate dehydratase